MEGKLTSALYERLKDYYQHRLLKSSFIEYQWQQWADRPGLLVYRAVQNTQDKAWIIYNAENSTIQDIIISPDDNTIHLESVLDALIARENLVAAQIWAEDREKYLMLVDYGFRPTRSALEAGFNILKLDLSTSVLLRKLKGHKPGWEINREVVAVEKVSEDSQQEEIKAGLERLLQKLGGIEHFVRPGQRVVIKPNIVSEHGLRDGIYKGGIVTDPRLVKALVEILLPLAGEIIIAEGASINRSETSKMFEHYGYRKIAALDPDKISLVDLNQDEAREKAVPRGKRMVSRKIPITLETADVIISVPVMKIHFAAVVSLSIKNLQGAVPPLEKYMSHFFGLWQSLININHLVKPALIIIDGLCGQEGFGPISGTPRQMDVLIAGTNPAAVDAVATRTMGLEPEDVPTCLMAYLQGFGPMDMDDIELIGPPLEDISRPFQQPQLDLSGGKDITLHNGYACPGCRAYLHFVMSKLRKPDPMENSRLLIDRPFPNPIKVYFGPDTESEINPQSTNVFIGVCQQHHAHMGMHIPGCPPHSEALIDGIYSLFPDVEKAKYADKSEEAKLGDMLQEILGVDKGTVLLSTLEEVNV